eukprot:scaffold17.g487.t1
MLRTLLRHGRLAEEVSGWLGLAAVGVAQAGGVAAQAGGVAEFCSTSQAAAPAGGQRFFSWQDKGTSAHDPAKTWKLLHKQGEGDSSLPVAANRCPPRLTNEGCWLQDMRSTLAGIEPDSEEELSVQDAYTPESSCWGCGPSAADGLFLKSFRIPGGLEATISLDSKYCAFPGESPARCLPGIMNGGVISALLDCHGNWTAAVALMDKGCLPKPPLTLTYEMLVTYKEPTPPDETLIIRSQIVDMNMYQSLGGHEKLLCSATGLFKKLGALRAL